MIFARAIQLGAGLCLLLALGLPASADTKSSTLPIDQKCGGRTNCGEVSSGINELDGPGAMGGAGINDKKNEVKVHAKDGGLDSTVVDPLAEKHPVKVDDVVDYVAEKEGDPGFVIADYLNSARARLTPAQMRDLEQQLGDEGLLETPLKTDAADLPAGIPTTNREGALVSGTAVEISGRMGNFSAAVIRAAQETAQNLENKSVSGSGSGTVRYSMGAGNNYLRANQPVDAERNFRRVVKADRTNIRGQEGLARSLYQQGRTDEAAALARNILEQQPDNRVAKMLSGTSPDVQRASGITGKVKSVTDDFLRGQREDDLAGGPANPDGGALSGRATGAAALLAGGPPGSGVLAGATPGRLTAQQIADIANAQRTGPAPIVYTPLVQKGVTKRELGDYTGALLVLSQAVDENPKDALAWTVRAEVDNALRNFPAAISDAGTALDLKPPEPISARALRARAYAHLESGEFQKALADASRSIELDPRSGLGFLYRAMAEERLGLTEAAARDLETAVGLDPSLAPLAAPLRDKLGLSTVPRQKAPRLDKRLVRGGAIALSLLLVLLGMLGTARGRELTRRWATPVRAAEDAPAELAPDTLLGGTYRVVRELGRGGMGVVYEGLDQTLQRRVAIKRLQRDALGSAEDVERFLREARLVAQLKHPNVAEIYTVVMEDEPFLVFEYVDGKSLDKVLALNKSLPVPAVRRLVTQVASALGAAHARDIIHRDLKPSNIMIAGDGLAKVMDFGVAHQARAAAVLTQTAAAGTPPYMAPEQGLGSVSKASDLYALGVMTYELLCGARPFEGPDYLDAKLQRRYEAITLRSSALPPGLDAFFAQALEPDPTKRLSNAALFSSEFDRACGA